MKHGVALHISHLQVGDVVRPLRGAQVKSPGSGPVRFTMSDGTIVTVNGTRDWINPEVGGPEDFRWAYDAMSVVEVMDDNVTFLRPYCHVYGSGPTTHGVETVANCSRTNGGLWYELLSLRSK